MKELREHFILVERPFTEGAVEVFQQFVEASDIKKAVLVITALGVYEAEINGKKVGDIFLAPGFTYYPRDLQYQEYDVTDLLTGKDVLKVYLGQGWYCGRFTFRNKTQIYGEYPAVSWMLRIESENGTIRHYCSDDSTVKAVESPYEYAGLYDGEIYRANGSKKEVIQPVKYKGALPEVIEGGTMYVRLREEMPVQTVKKRDNVTILDFGQNFAGVVSVDTSKMNGDYIHIRHGEILNQDGSLYTANLRKAKAEITCYKGNFMGTYMPKFTYMGFRYVEISGVDYVPGLITAHAVYSDMERTGHFSCENLLVRKLYENQIWGQKSNYIEVPTDCPQRDERMGYTGDGHVFAQTGAYNFDTEKFWGKFLKDIRYSQMDNEEGYVTPTVPSEPKEQRGLINMLGWGNCVCIIPEMLYWQYGTDKYIKEQYDSMKKFVECEIRHMGKGRKRDLWIAPSLGDWLTMGKGILYMALHSNPVSNAFVVNDLPIMLWSAKYLGKMEEAARYEKQLEKSRAAYIKRFIKADGRMKDDYQGAYIMALKMVIPKGELWDKIFAQLLKKIYKEGMQTGFFATEHILPLLTENGQDKLAYDLLLQENCPGWMYQIKHGATTTWERWDALRPDGSINESKVADDNMVSFNHYAFGSVGKFYYQHILGIKPLKPGYEKISICPYVDRRLGAVSGSVLSRKGEIKVAWKCEGNTVYIDIKVPTDAKITLPDKAIHEVHVGNYAYTVPLF